MGNQDSGMLKTDLEQELLRLDVMDQNRRVLIDERYLRAGAVDVKATDGRLVLDELDREGVVDKDLQHQT